MQSFVEVVSSLYLANLDQQIYPTDFKPNYILIYTDQFQNRYKEHESENIDVHTLYTFSDDIFCPSYGEARYWEISRAVLNILCLKSDLVIHK